MQKSIESGMITLRLDGWVKVLDGQTTIDEVVRVARKTEFSSGQNW
jgi:type II secretory ATPase GspE/PulE/Tfp pilus assembly ATPase PilB-like protein